MSMTESEFRSAITTEALTWLGTPYHSVGAIKGVGVNCSQFVYEVMKATVLPADTPKLSWFTPQLATHSKEERLIAYAQSLGAVEIAEAEAKPGDIILYKSGKAHGHSAIILELPKIIHVSAPGGCQMGNFHEGKIGAYARSYFTFWKES